MRTHEDNAKLFGSMYPNARDFANGSELLTGDYFVVDNFELFNGLYKKEGTGHFYEFLMALLDKGSARAPDTIKHYFTLPKDEVKLAYDGDSALYVLAKGNFGDESFVVKATSGNKYNKESYVIERT